MTGQQLQRDYSQVRILMAESPLLPVTRFLGIPNTVQTLGHTRQRHEIRNYLNKFRIFLRTSGKTQRRHDFGAWV